MAQPAAKSPHRWSFYRAGGVDQVRLDKGADILNLDQLDQKLWVALSCPVKGLEIDSRTLQLLDNDGDAHVRPPEILAAVKWLRDALVNPDSLVEGKDGVALANLRKDTAEGKALLASAQHILKSLGKEATSITVADSEKTADVFAKARRNGDGIVPPATVEDEGARAVAADIVACMGGAEDRSSQPGYDQARLDAFFAACADFDAWQKAGEADAKNVLPFGDGTSAAFSALTAVRAKIDDYFGRCRLAAYDPRALAAINREQEAYIAVAAKDLTITADEVRHFPLAIVEANKPLSLAKGVNPAWAAAVATFRATCCKDKETLTEADWTSLCSRFDAHTAWLGKKAGAAVEKLGKARVREILGGKTKSMLQQAIDDDKAVAAEVDAMARVEKLVRLHRDLHRLLNNYVSFTDFYARRGAIFQAGTLYLDGRACDMCFHVHDAGKHAKMAPMSNTYLAYVDCTRPGGEKMSVASAFTAGDSDNLFEGRNGIFYDRKGRDWDATVTKIVSAPISIRQAFWSPYKKVLRGIQEAIAKKAAAADDAATGKLAAGAAAAGDAAKGAVPPKPKFDIGMVAALGVAVGGISTALAGLLAGFFSLGPWIPFGIIGLFLAISTPSMFIAWLKLRQRNLGPILDANGWAVNTLTRVNVPLGGSLTAMPKIPPGSERSFVDPYAPKKSPWPKIFVILLVLAGIAYGLYRTNLLHKWLPDYFAAHHTELDLAADKTKAAPGDVVTFTVRSAAQTLAVTNATDSNSPVAMEPLPVASGSATLTIPAGSKPGTLVVRDTVSGTEVEITVVEKKQ
ncbi:MAG TPA: hypothetical protein VFZ65_07695 [Planctomycetota bacterium]|nr:hypothetical protein [Planctomycetota bacterium]